MKEIQKICYIISDINKALAFEWIAKNLNHEKFQLSFVLLLQEPSELEKFLKHNNISCTVFYYTTKKDLPTVLWKVYQLLKKQKPEIVHCHLLYGSLIGLTAAKLAGIKKRIYTRHHSDYHQRYFPKGIKWDKWCNRMATHIIAPSAAVKEVLMKMESVPDGKVQIVHHGFDLHYFTTVDHVKVENLRRKYDTSDHYPVIGVISRFTELKGIQYIIPAFSQLLQSHPSALLLLFGAHGDYATQLKEQLKALPDKAYRIIDFEKDIAAVYPLFDVFVQVSIDRTIEAFGQTYVEALAAGVPSVFTLSGIANDFIEDGKNAIVVPYKNVEAIYIAMMQLITNSQLREKHILNGKESIKDKFDLSVMIQKLEETYVA